MDAKLACCAAAQVTHRVPATRGEAGQAGAAQWMGTDEHRWNQKGMATAADVHGGLDRDGNLDGVKNQIDGNMVQINPL